MDADWLIASLQLAPHPEGGWFRETWRDPSGAGSAIFFLLREGETSAWHRVIDRAEVWHYYAGEPVRLEVDGEAPEVLGPDVPGGQSPQLVVPAGAWQRAEPLGAWSLVGCTVSPAFSFDAFQLSPSGGRLSTSSPPTSIVRGMLNTLAIDIGGTGLKASVLDENGQMEHDRVRIDTPYPLSPQKLVTVLEDLIKPLPPFDRVSVGFPGMVRDGLILSAPHFVSVDGPAGEPAPKLVKAWSRFDLEGALREVTGKPVKVANDADMQGAAVVQGDGLELVITLGTGVGTALFYQGQLLPHLEFAHHPFRKGATYNEELGEATRKRIGNKKWQKRVSDAIETFRALTFFDHCYLGGGNSARLDGDLPADVTVVDNSAGILGGIKLWQRTPPPQTAPPQTPPQTPPPQTPPPQTPPPQTPPPQTPPDLTQA
jgi:polyphosphate glucokinase